jgi:AcrR family transcriptional regulator
MPPSGRLQEEHRADTRQRLALAALELAQQHGADQIKPEDIAQRAGVSRRTFFNHVSSVSGALSVPIEDFLTVMRRNFLERLANANPYHAAAEAMSAMDPALIAPVARVSAVARSDAAQRYRFAAWNNYESSLREAISRHLDPELDPLYAHTVAAAIMGAGRVAVTMWTDEDPTGQRPERFVEFYCRALDYLSGRRGAPRRHRSVATRTHQRHDTTG